MKKNMNTKVNDQQQIRENMLRNEFRNMFDYVETFPSIDSYISYVKEVIKNKEDDPPIIFSDERYESQKQSPNQVSESNTRLKEFESVIKRYVETFPNFDLFVSDTKSFMTLEKNKLIDREYFKINDDLLCLLDKLDEVKEEIDECIVSLNSNEMIRCYDTYSSNRSDDDSDVQFEDLSEERMKKLNVQREYSKSFFERYKEELLNLIVMKEEVKIQIDYLLEDNKSYFTS